jgi:hypothetical protein
MNVLTVLTILSIVIALAMTGVVLRLALQERRRSAARVAALEADIYRTADEDVEVLHDPAATLQQALPPVFSPAVGGPGHQHRVPIAPVVAVAAAIAFGAAAGATRYRASKDQSPRQQALAATSGQALELLSLDHERADDHFTVYGMIRNPARGNEVDHLTAVVLVFNQQGGFLTSGRSPVESADLEPGTEAKFTVTVPGAADVGKYRVSFRTDDRVVPHVDRR